MAKQTAAVREVATTYDLTQRNLSQSRPQIGEAMLLAPSFRPNIIPSVMCERSYCGAAQPGLRYTLFIHTVWQPAAQCDRRVRVGHCKQIPASKFRLILRILIICLKKVCGRELPFCQNIRFCLVLCRRKCLFAKDLRKKNRTST